MKTILILAMALLMYGCASTPIPTEQFIATGSYTHKAGSEEVAMDKAKSFCRHWWAAVGVIDQKTLYQGKLLTEKQEEGIGMIKNSIPFVDGWGNRNAYQTTITYKCY